MSETQMLYYTNTDGSVASVTVPVHGYTEKRFKTFLGKILTLVDTLGLPQNQGEAFKSLIKQELWGFWEHPQYSEDKESMFGDSEK